MSDSIRKIVDQLRRQVLAAPKRALENARSRRATLGGHGSLAAVLDALADDSPATYPARDALTRDLVEEHRESRDPVWASILLIAYYPLLSHLRRRLISRSVPRDELDQVVVTSFLAAISEVPIEGDVDRIPMRLRQRTERLVFGYLRKEREHEHPTIDIESLANTAQAPNSGAKSLTDEEMFDLALLLERAAEEGIPQSQLEIVAATVLRRELLRSYVERMAPDDAVERERMYQRLKRQRSRVMRRLRELAAVPAARSS